jgi:hypothetical protein
MATGCAGRPCHQTTSTSHRLAVQAQKRFHFHNRSVKSGDGEAILRVVRSRLNPPALPCPTRLIMNALSAPSLSRREMLRASALVGGAWLAGARLFAGGAVKPRPKVAALFTELRFRSHAYNILENFFEPYLFCGELVDPGCDVVSFYADQFPDGDLAREVSKRFNVPLYKTIDEAMCRGGKELAVDAVLLIGEHGDYPHNELHQHLYPRKQFFDQAVAVMRRAGRYLPLFNDKHLSYRWDWAKEMYDTARRNGFPLMAGSSVPLAERRPPLELPAGTEFESALVVQGGGMEVYGFHGLEVLQSIVEARRGGETGIHSVEVVVGDAFQRGAKEGRWPQELFDAAMTAERNIGVTRQPRPSAGNVQPPPPARQNDPTLQDHAILVTYRDGLKAAVVRSGSESSRWNFACRVKGESQPQASAFFNGPWGNRNLFKALSHAIQYLFVERREPYPVERTLLTTGAIEAAMKSFAAGKAIETPHLDIAYQPVDFRAFRENGASWRRLTADIPQPSDFEPGDAKRLAN